MADAKEFLKRLPPDEFTPWEVALRQAILDGIDTAKRSSRGRFPIIEWINHRMGGEVQCSSDARGDVCIRGSRAAEEPPSSSRDRDAGKGKSKGGGADAFFRSLPGDSFLSGEDALRDKIFDFLASWKSHNLADLDALSKDRAVQDCMRSFMPPGASLEEWIERRIGGEVTLEKKNGKQIINLQPSAREIVVAKFEALKKQPEPKRDGRPADKEKWFATLKADELSPQELALRQAVLGWIEYTARGKAPDAPRYLSESNKDQEIRRCSSFIPNGIQLRDWIDKRIGAEVETWKDPQGHILVGNFGEREQVEKAMTRTNSRTPPPAPPAPGSKGGGRHATAPPGSKPPPPPVKPDDFFKGLPEDSLTDDELSLREALVGYLESHPGKVLLADIAKEPEMSDVRTKLLPAEVPLRQWIDRRIGGEIAVEKNAKGSFTLQLRREAGDAEMDGAGDSSGQTADEFFAALPEDSFLPEEESLREALLKLFETKRGSSSHSISQVESDSEVRRYVSKVLPAGCPVSLREYIDRRLGGEIECGEDSSGQLYFGFFGELQIPQKRKSDQGKGSGKNHKSARR